jgi:hypothetical protein
VGGVLPDCPRKTGPDWFGHLWAFEKSFGQVSLSLVVASLVEVLVVFGAVLFRVGLVIQLGISWIKLA